MKRICPSICIDDIFSIDYLFLWKQGFRLLVFDLDHTMLPCSKRRLTVKTRRKLRELHEIGFQIAFLTNTVVPWREKRARDIARSAKIKKVILVCCNGFHCKPRPWGFNEICRIAGILPDKAVMIGDMLWRDIEGAQKAGFGCAILVKPHGPDNIFIRRCRRKELEIKKWLEEIGLYHP